VIAEALLAQHPLERVTVRVHKPAAPIRNPFDDIVATVTRTRT
jgi:dihydroneopterin aldolase